MNIAKKIQLTMKKAGFYDGKIDGKFGNKSKNSVEAIIGYKPKNKRDELRAAQVILKTTRNYSGEIDGFYGPATESGFEQYLKLVEKSDFFDPNEASSGAEPGKWPIYKRIKNFYGEPGQGNVLTKMTFPFRMRIAWDLDSSVTRTTVNKKCKASFEEWFEFLLDHYGADGVRELDIDLFGGLTNVRKIRNGNSWSTHAFGCAIDLSPQKNGLHTSWKKSQFSDKVYMPMFEKFRSLGGMNLGEALGRDLMHFDFIRRQIRHTH